MLVFANHSNSADQKTPNDLILSRIIILSPPTMSINIKILDEQ